MDPKLFKNFTPYINRADKPLRAEDLAIFAEFPVADPNGQQWTTGGFYPFYTGEFVVDVNGAALMAMIQVNERILPASVIKENMVKRIAEIENRDQRKANKKDYAQVKDEVTARLLPKAFIRRTYIPLLFVTGRDGLQYVLVFTGSAKKADDVMLSLSNAFSHSRATSKRWEPALLSNVVKKDIVSTLNGCATGESLDDGTGNAEGRYLTMGRSAVLKGRDKQKITIKEKDIGSAEVQGLLGSTTYDVIRLAMDFYDGDVDPAAEVTITDKLVFTGYKVAAVKKTTAEDEADAEADALHNIWIVARTSADMLSTVIDGLDGIRPKGETPPTEIEPEEEIDDVQRMQELDAEAAHADEENDAIARADAEAPVTTVDDDDEL